MNENDESDEEETGRKRVGFEIEVEENDGSFDGDDICRLQRKDTPHHLKGKRIVKDDESRLQDILLSMKQKSEDHENDSQKSSEKEETEVEDSAWLSHDQIEDKKRGIRVVFLLV